MPGMKDYLTPYSNWQPGRIGAYGVIRECEEPAQGPMLPDGCEVLVSWAPGRRLISRRFSLDVPGLTNLYDTRDFSGLTVRDEDVTVVSMPDQHARFSCPA